MKPTVLGIVVVLALLAAGAIFFGSNALAPEVPLSTDQTYANDTYGISFTYPEGYVLSETAVGEGQYVITLIKEEDAVPRVNSEGPTAINVTLYDNTETTTLREWVTTANESNYQLGTGALASTTISGKESLTYRWSGLYEGETTAFVSGDTIVAVSVTYMSLTDAIYTDYLGLLSSLQVR